MVADQSVGRGFPDLRTLGRTWGSVEDSQDHACGSRYAITRADGGRSVGAFARGNLADHVDDDPAAVEHNRGQLAVALGAYRGLAFVRAVHGRDVAWAESAGTYRDVDALITDTPGLGLVALGADCAVVGLHGHRDDGSPLVAVAHCGWRGLVEDVIASVVDEMRIAGGRDLQAVLGPAICGGCYRVDFQRFSRVLSAVSPRVAGVALREGDETDGTRIWGIDIRRGTRERLIELGVGVVEDPELQGMECTLESESWFSFRRACVEDGAGRTGRHGLAAVADRVPGDDDNLDARADAGAGA